MNNDLTSQGGDTQSPPVTVAELLKKTSGFAKKNYDSFCSMFNLTLESPISQEDFKGRLKAWRVQHPQSKSKTTTKKRDSKKKQPAGLVPAQKDTNTTVKEVRYEVVDCEVQTPTKAYPSGSVLPKDFPADEIERLLKKGKIRKQEK